MGISHGSDAESGAIRPEGIAAKTWEGMFDREGVLRSQGLVSRSGSERGEVSVGSGR